MTDRGAEPALDAEPGDVGVEFMNNLVTQFINSRADFFGRHFNLGSQPEENKDTKTPVRKRICKPKHSPKAEVLKKEVNKLKSKVHKKYKKLQTTKYSDRVKVIMARVERDKTSLRKIFEMMEKNKIQIDETAERKSRILTKKIDKIKNKIDEINGQDAENKVLMDQQFQKWERKEARARTKLEKSIEERSSLLDVAKEKAKQNIQAAKDEIVKIDLEIQNTKDAEDWEVTNIRKNIEAKENTLAKIKDQCDKNIKRMIETEAERIAGIDAIIKKLKDDESKKKEEIDSNITAKRKAYDDCKRKFRQVKHDIDRKIQKIKHFKAEEKRKMAKETEKRLKILKIAEDEYDKMLLHQKARNREIEDVIIHLD